MEHIRLMFPDVLRTEEATLITLLRGWGIAYLTGGLLESL
jgi:hypothetical protein